MSCNVKDKSNSNYNTGSPPVMDNTNATTIGSDNQKYIDSLNYNPKYIAIYSFKLARILIRKGFIAKDIRKNYKLDKKETVFYFEYSEALNDIMQNYINITSKEHNNL